jgi:hypothetical protein
MAATVGAERERYLWTLASADTLLVLERVALTLGRPDHAGWAGEAALRRETFPDGNALTSASAWILAPVAPGVRIGWAASLADARETRWSPGPGRYLPYYTPEEQHVQSLLAELGAPLGRASVRVSGRYGVWATEQAPAAGSSPLAFVERSYHPWSATAGLEAPATDELTVYVQAERSATAFYALTRASVALLVRLGSEAGS